MRPVKNKSRPHFIFLKRFRGGAFWILSAFAPAHVFPTGASHTKAAGSSLISEGAGAEMRRTPGTAVFGGMLGVTLFGIFLTPVFYYVIQWFNDRRLGAATAPVNGTVTDAAPPVPAPTGITHHGPHTGY